MQRNNTMTLRFLADAGIGLGMRVLEIGCGGGEVTELLAELVGPSGAVVAVDRDPKGLTLAQSRLAERGFRHVRFLQHDLAEGVGDLDALEPGRFDALTGRRVLMYLPEPARTLGQLSRWLRSGSVVVFEETDTTMVPGRVSVMPAHDQAQVWLRAMLASEGANLAMGFHLPATLVQAGFTFVGIRAEAVIQGQGTQYPLPDLLALVQSRLVSTGVATQTALEALIHQIKTECHDVTSVYISEMSFCAWGRKP